MPLELHSPVRALRSSADKWQCWLSLGLAVRDTATASSPRVRPDFATVSHCTSGTVLRTNLKHANRKILISMFVCYVSIVTLSHIYNAQMTYAALCFSTKYLLPLLSLLIDPKYAVVPSCLFLSLVHMCDDNLQPHNDVVVHSVSCTCR